MDKISLDLTQKDLDYLSTLIELDLDRNTQIYDLAGVHSLEATNLMVRLASAERCLRYSQKKYRSHQCH